MSAIIHKTNATPGRHAYPVGASGETVHNPPSQTVIILLSRILLLASFWFRPLIMADIVPRAVPKAPPFCVYNIPLALDHTHIHTHGLEPHFAKNRNANLLADCKRSIAGPMPVQQFMDHFLPLPSNDNRTNMLDSLDAFKSVPRCGVEASKIYEPLVSCLLYCSCPISLNRPGHCAQCT